jgi:hypothetical protein
MFPIVPAGPALEGAGLPAFVVAGDGLYLRKRSLLGVSQTRAGRIDALPDGAETLDYALPPVPADVMARAVGFFRAAYRLHRTEAAVLLLWRDGGFGLAAPSQRVTAVSVEFDVAPGDVPPGARVVGSMHSHGAYGAYASATDQDDEAGLDGLHLVVGRLDQRRPSYAGAVVVDGVRFQLKAERLFERPRRPVEPPAEWLAKVTVAPPARRPRHKSTITELGNRRPLSSGATGRPSRRELEATIERAAAMAASLGLRLSHRLVPVEDPAEPEEARGA